MKQTKRWEEEERKFNLIFRLLCAYDEQKGKQKSWDHGA